MQDFRMGEAARILGVSVDTLRRWADAGRLPTRRTEGGHRIVHGTDLARIAAALTEIHEPDAIAAQSARNRFTGIVTRVVKDGVMAQVEMQAGPFRVVSLMSREAAEELELAPGVLAVAAVKATHVVVELPAEG
ncbi:MAG: TOBE domain-containing protein [Actinomycetota bacterium]